MNVSEDYKQDEKIEVKFVTKLDQYRVIDKSFQVPTSLNRRGLSQLINHLLGTETPIPFDFLVGNHLLRSSLKKFIQQHQCSTEQVLTLEYVKLLDPPTPESIKTHSDWISSIDDHLLTLQNTLSKKNLAGYVIPYGSYDCYVNLLHYNGNSDENSAPMAVGRHSQPVLSVSSFPIRDNDGQQFGIVSGSQDCSVYVWNVNLADQRSRTTQELVGHQGAVEAVSCSPDANLVATASWDNTIKLWNLQSKESKKTVQAQARNSLVGHMQCVSTLFWLSNGEIISGSWDHSIKIWDVESGINTHQLTGNKVILNMDYSFKNKLLIAGHADRSIRIWDIRSSDLTSHGNSVSTSYSSHTGWVNAVKWHPSHEYLAISGSYDSNIKIWDIRSTTPLYTLASQHQDKIFTLGWLDSCRFTSGGADNALRMYSMPDTAISI
ncbi:ribosome biogenesis protein WDR12 homolog [Schistocerca gregaria]|uniref:ribosome biogenesis protein WDR12 homolog n=1 Tax=Schistocerca gregaria TaxID=7010 RepID=UPI00211EA76C|nr:ribosome biogenesis protein WDR12 homolog [Schistocerca gregaria]